MKHDNEYTLAVMIGITAELKNKEAILKELLQQIEYPDITVEETMETAELLRQVTKAKEDLTLRFNLELKRLKPLGVTDETTD